MKRILWLLPCLLLCGCANYMSTAMRQSTVDRIYLSQRQIEQSYTELQKLYTHAYTDSWNWAADANVVQSWAPSELAETRATIDENRRHFQTFLQKLDESRKLLDTVRQDIGG